MDAVELVVSSSTQRGSYSALAGSTHQFPYRQIGAVVGVVVLGVCALLVLVGNANLSPDDSVLHAMSLSVRSQAPSSLSMDFKV
jgi:hypothetical protein